MILKILTTPSPKLRQKAQKILNIDEKIVRLAKDMFETKQANFGIGLAGPQVGENKRIIAVEDMVLINPEIIYASKEQEEMEEGCLSLPGLAGVVLRAKEITVKALKLTPPWQLPPKEVKISASGLLARTIQHEIDHLDGILFTDKVADIRTLKNVPVPYKVVFMGTPEFAVSLLEGLYKSNWAISCVITEPDKPFGRKQTLTPPPIKKCAQKYNLLIYQPKKIIDLKKSLLNLCPDIIIVAAYGQILPKEILEIPSYGCICVHPSLLPKYRGPSPIQTAILKGEKETGVSIFKMDEKIDHGPIISSLKLDAKISTLNTEELSKELAKLGTHLLLKTLPLYLERRIKPKPQNHKEATYTKLIKKEDGFIENSKLKTQDLKIIQEIERKIRAFYPWPKVWTLIGNKRIIIHKAHIENSKLVLDIVQPEGKKPMKYEDYLKGNPAII